MTRKPIIYTADAARIDDDEGRISIVIDTDEGDKLYVDIHGVALAFYASVQADLRPYALEAESARTAVASGMSLGKYLDSEPWLDPDELHATPQMVTNRPVDIEDAIEAGYALDDPKSPGYHDRMVD